MKDLPKKLVEKLEKRKDENAFRQLSGSNDLVDFSSNDYLGFARDKVIYQRAAEILEAHNLEQNGSGGSRLLTGNHALYDLLEQQLANFHESEAALVYNSGFDANMGLLSCVPQRGDIILFDALVHASIREGINASNAKAYKFSHNDLIDLEEKLTKHRPANDASEMYVVTESVFSMDGDSPDLSNLCKICELYRAHLIIDEAHATGVMGKGMIQGKKLTDSVFARLVTFGKALGCHGATILGSGELKTYLSNYSKSLIYTTALPPHSVATVLAAYERLENTDRILVELRNAIDEFKGACKTHGLDDMFIPSESAIQSCIISGNERVKKVSKKLANEGFDVKPILAPTVPEGEERLRICLHYFNTREEIERLVQLIATFTQ